MFCGLVDVRALLSGVMVQTIMCTASMCVGCWVVGWGFCRGAVYVFDVLGLGFRELRVVLELVGCVQSIHQCHI